jgi:hypothetical protein
MEKISSKGMIPVLVTFLWATKEFMKRPEADAHRFHQTASKKI